MASKRAVVLTGSPARRATSLTPPGPVATVRNTKKARSTDWTSGIGSDQHVAPAQYPFHIVEATRIVENHDRRACSGDR